MIETVTKSEWIGTCIIRGMDQSQAGQLIVVGRTVSTVRAGHRAPG